MNEYLNIDYSKSLDQQPYKELYARLTALTHDELPLETFEGLITGGNLSISGNSAIRRTCSLNVGVSADANTINDVHWALKHKFKLEIGVRSNDANEDYTEIQWFKQGIFIITNFNKSETTSNYTISISGQDKMCQLNGTIGGTFPMEIDFGQIDIEQTDGSVITEKVPIRTIIEQSVSQYGNEPMHNIIINDLPNYGLELIEYRGKTPLYMIATANTQTAILESIVACTFDEDSIVYVEKIPNLGDINEDGKINQDDVTLLEEYLNGHIDLDESAKIRADINQNGSINNSDKGILQRYIEEPNLTILSPKVQIKLKDIPNYWILNPLSSKLNTLATPIYQYKKSSDTQKFYVIKLEYGNTVGYRTTELTYAGDLICKAGENVEGLLSKIQKMLGEFEYFYDVDGHFVFQKKKIYLSELFSPKNGDIIEPLMITTPYSYTFQDLNLVTSVATTPAISKVKNDFIIWGKKQSAAGAQIDIHVRYAIDKKPVTYNSPWETYELVNYLSLMYACKKLSNTMYLERITGKVYEGAKLNENIYTCVDAHYTIADFNDLKTGDNFYYNSKTQNISFKVGETTKVQLVQKTSDSTWENINLNNYYVLNNKNYIPLQEWDNEIVNYNQLYCKQANHLSVNNYDWRELIYRMALDYSQHNQEVDFLYKITSNNPDTCINGITGYERYYTDLLAFWRILYNPYDNVNYYDTTAPLKEQYYWNKQVYENAENLIFWFDFLDAGGAEISKYSIPEIGLRTKVENNASNSTTIFQNQTPEVILFRAGDKKVIQPDFEGYSMIQVPDNVYELMSISSQGTPLVDKINSCIYNDVIVSEGVNISIIPIYHLEPNTRIYVEGIGDLIITQITCPLGHNSTMTLTCQKPLPRIY